MGENRLLKALSVRAGDLNERRVDRLFEVKEHGVWMLNTRPDCYEVPSKLREHIERLWVRWAALAVPGQWPDLMPKIRMEKRVLPERTQEVILVLPLLVFVFLMLLVQ